MMLYPFRKIAEKHQLWNVDDCLLVAVSGGIDSMVLLDLCRQLYNPVAVAHCNFCLRGKAADADEDLVRKVCAAHNLVLHSNRFDTTTYAKAQGISIEMAARSLRYEYFHELCQKYGYTKILTAHHANDNAETLLLNLVKGTGIRGLTGIPQERGNIVRPLLTFTRHDLQQYAHANQLEYREDATNKETVFQRNKIRHEVLPLLEKINPIVVQTLNADSRRLQEVRAIYEDYIGTRLEHLVNKKSIFIKELLQEKYSQSLLYEWLNPLGFSATVVSDILATLADTEEKIFLAQNYRLIKSRGKLQITQHRKTNEQTFEVTEKGCTIPIKLTIEHFSGKMQKAANIAYFDTENLKFPLQLRRWKEGDRLFPFGMKGSKKVSELFKDNKLTTLEKENMWLLCSANNIVWVVGVRTDDRYKITTKTKDAIQITWKQ